MESAVLVIYGVGGHKEEAERLMDKLHQANGKPLKLIALCEEGVKPSANVLETWYVPEFRKKDVRPLLSLFDMLRCSVCVLRQLLKLRRQYRVSLAISTGPGLAIPAFFWCKIIGIKTLFVESWCRFYQRSFSGNVCRFMADRFYYQNKSMQSLYPKGRWSGRL